MGGGGLAMLRPAWVEVDLNAIAHNTSGVKRHVAPRKLLAVVKADGYGCGAVQVARVMLANGADMLGVVLLDEAVQLRRAGLRAPILNLGGILPEHASIAVAHDIAQTVNTTEVAQALSRAAQSLGKKAVVHFKVDTGMSRWGVRFDQAATWIAAMAQLPGLQVEGVYSHFAMSDALDKSFSELQLSRFQMVRQQVAELGVQVPIWHMANSGAILDLPQAHFDMVRCGLLLYGYYPSPDVQRPLDLLPAMAVRARVMQVNQLRRGDTVGYGRRYMAEKPERIAVLQIGYADGYDRGLRNVGTALLRGQRAPIVGGICMDACFVRVEELGGAEPGEVVTLMGRDGEAEISPHDIADTIGSVSYEVMSRYGARLPRVYVKDGRPVSVKSLATDFNEEAVVEAGDHSQAAPPKSRRR
ncbi:MAG: alanine racemase [candidate division KSB1 bacterium]|nr:alanine racemase [candidate division KSB1 bacterium]